jgi:hypothetical protein
VTSRALAGAAAGAALAGFVLGALSVRDPEPPPPAAPAPVAAEPRAEPLPPAPFPAPERTRVPAGILARAANARALDRGPACPPVQPPEEPARCSPEQRESIEIEWHVAPRDR